ncbi:MAG: BatA domain-containing protein, partial [Defluviicoccus sp.]|nr:BatA domain-containing protein [Defluviicoccus sp.]
MLTLGALSFAVPGALVALGALPVLWYLLRATPPKPRRIVFPPLQILAGLVDRDRVAVRTPWWLIVLRLSLAGALILAAAEPLLSEGKDRHLEGPLLIVVDDGWASAKNWPLVRAALARLSDEAERSGQPALLLPTAPRAGTAEPAAAPIFVPAGRLRALTESLEPKPWAVDRVGALAALKAAGGEALRQAQAAGLAVIWLADGLAANTPMEPGQERADTASADRAFLAELQRLGPVTVYLPDPGSLPFTLRRVPARDGRPDTLTVSRPQPLGPAAARVRLVDDEGRLLASVDLAFPADARTVSERPQLAAEWRARLNRIEVAGEGHAGAVLLADQRWQRPPVGIVAPADADQPLLAGAYFLERALEPVAEVRRGTIEALLQRELTLMILVDAG